VILIGDKARRCSGCPRQAAATPATELGANETTHDYPEFLPDGRHFLYLARHAEAGGLGPLCREPRLEGAAACCQASTPERHTRTTDTCLFVRDGTLMAHPFDLVGLESLGMRLQ